ncbi:TPA: hypothetical protein ACGO3F_001752 [Streptococcus suis]
MNVPLSISTTKVCKEEPNVETSILKAGPTFDFDIELKSAMNQYDELLKELADR